MSDLIQQQNFNSVGMTDLINATKGQALNTGALVAAFNALATSIQTLSAYRIVPVSSQFTITTSSTSTTVAVPGLLLTSKFRWYPAMGNIYAPAFMTVLQPTSQTLGSITFSHPSTTNTIVFDYDFWG